MAIASSSAAMIFKIILHPSVGIANKVLNSNINWLTDPKYALICVAVLTAWLNSGINFYHYIIVKILIYFGKKIKAYDAFITRS